MEWSMDIREVAGQSSSYTTDLPRIWARTKQAFLNPGRLLHYALFGVVGTWLNMVKSPFMIEYRPDFHMLKDFSDYQALRRAWTRGNPINNGGDFTRFYALYQNLKQIVADDVPGDFVELGVYKGNSAAMLASVARKAGRHTYLFDTFGGFDTRDMKDVDKDKRTLSKMFTNTSISNVENLVGKEMVTYVQGFFPDSLTQIDTIKQIAVVHIDCDLHMPTKAALETFYPVIARGGLIIVHDYFSGHWTGVTTAVDRFFSDKAEKPVLIPDKSGTAIIRKV
jgi:predicted O-methyltransferase YrrM